MPYLETLDADLARARQILEVGIADALDDPRYPVGMGPCPSCGCHSRHAVGCTNDWSQRLPATIYGKDTYAAYKLLESFVEEIERLRREYSITHITWNAEGVRVVNGVPDTRPDTRSRDADAEPTTECAGCTRTFAVKTTPLWCIGCVSATTNKVDRLAEGLRRAGKVLDAAAEIAGRNDVPQLSQTYEQAAEECRTLAQWATTA